MPSSQGANRPYELSRLQNIDRHEFAQPVKKINDGDDLQFWLTSTAYRDLTLWLLQLNRSMFSTCTADGTSTVPCSLRSPPTFPRHVESVRRILAAYTDLIDKAPPKTGPRRFGNVAFRDWVGIAESSTNDLLEAHLGDLLRGVNGSAIQEVSAYLLGSFGSAQRLDYGTGHELSFLAFLACLWKLGAFESGDERSIVMGTIQPYLELMRKLILTYTLEPAGSHGVWGLDDHSFVPYIFGSAQLGPAINAGDHEQPVPTEGSLPSAPSPTIVAKKEMVADYKDDNMYFSAVQFIYDVKRGPFWEHSPVLFDISGIKDGWGKINKGMLKMYAAEVLGKFPVVQHFNFGSLFVWEQDPAVAVSNANSAYSPRPPPAVSKDVAQPPAHRPARTAHHASLPTTQASTGLPTTRVPWTSTPPGAHPSATSARGAMPQTAAPWATASRTPSQSTSVPTAAPWATNPTTRRP